MLGRGESTPWPERVVTATLLSRGDDHSSKEDVMQTAKTPQRESTAACPALLLAFELDEFGWTLGFPTSPAQRARRRQVPAGDIGRVLAEIATAKRRFHLPEDASVTSCYEADARDSGCTAAWKRMVFAIWWSTPRALK
jgi:hypothetical protein